MASFIIPDYPLGRHSGEGRNPAIKERAVENYGKYMKQQITEQYWCGSGYSR